MLRIPRGRRWAPLIACSSPAANVNYAFPSLCLSAYHGQMRTFSVSNSLTVSRSCLHFLKQQRPPLEWCPVKKDWKILASIKPGFCHRSFHRWKNRSLMCQVTFHREFHELSGIYCRSRRKVMLLVLSALLSNRSHPP